MASDDFRAQIEANFFGVVNVARAALPCSAGNAPGCSSNSRRLAGAWAARPGWVHTRRRSSPEGFSEVLANEVKPFGVKVMIIEPGAFRTDWQGSSMRLHEVGADYEPSVGEINRMRERTNGTQPWDPARAARIIVEVVGSDDPPRRLLLGAGAVAQARDAATQRAAELEQWADLSATADFPQQTASAA